MISLQGKWEYQTNVETYGELQTFEEKTFTVPGSNIENEIGTPYEKQTGLTEDNVKRLEKNYDFIGKLWLKKELIIENYSETTAYQLFIERAMWKTELWINGEYVGTNDSLSTAHCFDVTNYVKEENELIFCIDNQDIHEINTTPSAYTEETQSIWNGLIGQCYIEEIEGIQPIFQLQVNQQEKKIG